MISFPDWQAPVEWPCIRTVDAHTAGEPLRIILSGFPELAGTTLLERRRAARSFHDRLRTSLMWEPRGHADMYGCLVVPAVSAGADFGVLFLHNEGYSSMCGHGIIAVTKVMLQLGFLPMNQPETVVRIDTPAGLVTAYAHTPEGKVDAVSFHNVPSYVVGLDQEVSVPGWGTIRYDLAFGGAFYAYLDVAQVGLSCDAEHFRALIEAGMAIKCAVMGSHKLVHPFEEDLGFLYGVIFIGEPDDPTAHSRNVCVFAEGEVDRSPTGTGVSGRMAIHHARGELAIGEKARIESIIGTSFIGQVVETTRFGPYDAVIPRVTGNAFITGKHEFLLDPEDPLSEGFILR